MPVSPSYSGPRVWCLDGDHGFSLTCLAVQTHSASLSLTCRLASGVRLFGVDLYCCICVLLSPMRMKPPLLENKSQLIKTSHFV